jgi:hypothetical protein
MRSPPNALGAEEEVQKTVAKKLPIFKAMLRKLVETTSVKVRSRLQQAAPRLHQAAPWLQQAAL